MNRCALLVLVALACNGNTDTDKSSTTETDTDTDTDTDSDADTDTSTGDTATEIVYEATDLALEARGVSKDCLLKWTIESTPSSYNCPSCKFELDWQFDLTYTLAKKETTIEGCQLGGKDKNGMPKPYELQDAFVSSFYAKGPTFTKVLNNYYSWLAHTSDGKGFESVLLGYPAGNDIYRLKYTGGTWNPKSGEVSFDAYYAFTVTGTVTPIP